MSEQLCARCGKPVPPSVNFCGNCGNRVIDADSGQTARSDDGDKSQTKTAESKPRQWITPLLLVVGVIIVLTIVSNSTSKSYFDKEKLNKDLGVQLTRSLGAEIKVTCPANIPMEKGEITDCIAEDGYSRRIVRVTQDDSKGHFTFLLTKQDAP